MNCPPWNTITKKHDTFGRATGFDLSDMSYAVQYSYDTFGRFSSVSSSVPSVPSVLYSYLPASDLISEISNIQSQIHTTKSYEDHRNLLTQVNNSLASTTLSQYDYTNDSIGRRTSVKHSGTAFDVGPAFNAYGYNARSEVTNAARYWGADLGDTNDPVDGQAYAYAYDNIGNRTSASRNASEASYTANSLNQYTQRTISDAIDVLGSAETNSTVTVNNLATTRFGKYWHKGLTVTNDSSSVYQSVSVCGVYNPPGTNDPDIVTTSTGHVFVAKTPESFTYDADGNLLTDGRFTYTWDAENRLIAAQTLTNLPASVPRKRVEFAYDYQSRRVSKTVSSWVSNDWATVETHANVCNDLDLLREEVSNSQQTTTNWYIYGLDLSGSLDGAGGIGGLLYAAIGTNSVVYSYDASGNVSELVDTQSSTITAHYEYSPFGETIVATGPLARENKFRFSTKPVDDVTGLVLYEFRPYQAPLGRWLSKEPIGEQGAVNLLAFLANCPITGIEYLGLLDINTNLINCIGYAADVGGSLFPGEDSLASTFNKLGWTCKESKSGDCKCDCKTESAIMVYVYIKVPKSFRDNWERKKADVPAYFEYVRNKYKGKDVWNDLSWSPEPEGVDFHGIKKNCSVEDGNVKSWEYIGSNRPKTGGKGSGPFTGLPDGYVSNADDYWSNKAQVLKGMCCTRSR